MVQSKADRERQKLITDKCQSLIEVLLKDEDNKYCVDCDAKGPRWASWNLGIFLCIRCAGIHRNLGVHISKVKSVNLDAWTPEHVAYVQRMGNSRARAIYEANLPDDFRRPQTDTALESFIRAKYEHKKYIAQDYVDPGPPPPAFNIDEELKRMKEQKRSKVVTSTTRMISVTDLPSNPKPRPTDTLGLKNKIKNTPGLVDLETVTATEAVGERSKNTLDLLIGIDLNSSSDQTIAINQQSKESSQKLAPIANNSIDLDLNFTAPASEATDSSKKVLTKESILSLYSFSPTANVSGPAGTDPFGLNTSNDFFKPTSASGSSNAALDLSMTAPSNIPTSSMNLMNMSAGGLTSLLGGNASPIKPDDLLAPFGNHSAGGTTNSSSKKQHPRTGSSNVKNSNLDDLFAGLDILHHKN